MNFHGVIDGTSCIFVCQTILLFTPSEFVSPSFQNILRHSSWKQSFSIGISHFSSFWIPFDTMHMCDIRPNFWCCFLPLDFSLSGNYKTWWCKFAIFYLWLIQHKCSINWIFARFPYFIFQPFPKYAKHCVLSTKWLQSPSHTFASLF